MSARTQEEKRGCFVFAARIAQLHCLLYEALFLITGPKGNSDFCYPKTHVPSGKAKVNFGSGRNCKKMFALCWLVQKLLPLSWSG